MRSELHQHDVSLETALSEGLEPIMGDRVQLQQVILNLIMNGIEAMSAVLHQTPVLRVRSHDRRARRCADCGRGFGSGARS